MFEYFIDDRDASHIFIPEKINKVKELVYGTEYRNNERLGAMILSFKLLNTYYTLISK